MTADLLPVLPILVCLLFAALCVFSRKSIAAQHFLGTAGAITLCIAAYVLFSRVSGGNIFITYVGNWVPPFGITIVTDTLSATLVLTTSIIALAIMIYARADIDDGQVARGFYPLAFLLIMGVNGAFLTGDIFNLYVWFEVMLISSFSLLVLGRKKEQIRAAISYVTLNLVKTILFLTSVGLLYGTLGTLNMADIHLAVQDVYVNGDMQTLRVIAVMLLLAFGIKAGIFPLYFWLPASYHTPSPAIGALFAALLTKVGLYAMLRIFTIVLPLDEMQIIPLVGVVAMVTMLVPILGAIAEFNLRRILSFCLLSHIGVMMCGLAIFNHTALSGMVFYMIHHMIVMACLFLMAGILRRIFETDDIRRMGGLLKHSPALAWLLFIPLISIAGLPPLSGFWSKMLLVKGGLEGGHYVLSAAMLLIGFLTLYAMLRIWHMVVWRDAPAASAYNIPSKQYMIYTTAPAMALALISLWIGILPETLATLSHQVATMLFDPSIYVDTVTGGTI